MSSNIERTRQIHQLPLDKDTEGIIRCDLFHRAAVAAIKKSYASALTEFLQPEWSTFMVKDHSKINRIHYNSWLGAALPTGNELGTNTGFLLNKASALFSDKEIKQFLAHIPADLLSGIKQLQTYQEHHWIGIEGGSYCMETGQYADWNDEDSVHLSMIRLDIQEISDRLLSGLLEIPEPGNLASFCRYMKEQNLEELSGEQLETVMGFFFIDPEQVFASAVQTFNAMEDLDSGYQELLEKSLLECDKRRADLEQYDQKMLHDINAGHWELWPEEQTADDAHYVNAKPLIARNPKADIRSDGLIGIDFGTKSTIVSVENSSARTTLLRIGIGKLSSAVEKSHYENPTIMEFVDLDQFLKDYTAQAGRPHTSIQDVTVSHKANNNLKNCVESDFFYSYFYDIKQWCGDTGREIKIIDQKNHERLLPSFVSLKEDEFNPLEVYAYYLGLYINNMRNGVYMEYILSFPVTYTKEVKKKILDSFTRGLKKSLPQTILNDDELMKHFRVTQGVSEPAAYAITALQEFGFEPEEEDETVFYAIFDFGGGTTDFDFGIYRCPKEIREEERYDFVIEQFGSEGDKYLGGENLLELMAYEIFKANANLLQPQNKKSGKESAGFSFSKPAECEAFPGSETLISNSQEARRNTKQLMEVLRPFWEGIVGECTADQGQSQADSLITYGNYRFLVSDVIRNISEQGMVSVDLFDRAGMPQPNQTLYLERQDLDIHVDLLQILENRIDRGVTAFFESIKLAFEHHRDLMAECNTDEIEIFLAGNSSKSPILRKCFAKHIEESNQAICRENKNADGDHYKLFPPLGTEEANAILRERGISVNHEVTAPTGKTGVAYGLIAGREGGMIKVIAEVTAEEETKFRYNLGRSRREKFRLFLDRNEAVYNEWHRFIDAGSEYFEIFYTAMPGMEKRPVTASGIYKKRCRLETVDPAQDVYIRVVSPDELEYRVAGGKPDAAETGTRVKL